MSRYCYSTKEKSWCTEQSDWNWPKLPKQ